MKKWILSLAVGTIVGLGANLSATVNADSVTQQPQVRDYGMNGLVIRREERVISGSPINLLEFRSVATATQTNFNVSANAFLLSNANVRIGASGWIVGRHQAVARSSWRWDHSRQSGEMRTGSRL